MKIGQKMTMISVHSSGQPSRKMMSWAVNWKPSGERFIESTQRSISDWPPCSAKTAEKSAEPTNSQHTIAVVLAVRNVACLRFSRSSGDVRRYQIPGITVPVKVPPIEAATTSDATSSPSYQPSPTPTTTPSRLHHHTAFGYRAITARYSAPSAPIAADSVAVQMPKRITTSTTTVRTPSGTTDTISSLRISSCSPLIRQKYQSRSKPQKAADPQNH